MDKRDIDLKKELDSLKLEEINFQFIKEFKCNSVEEFEIFKQTNSNAFERLRQIKSRIRELEEQLMTEEEKEKKQAYYNHLKDKYKNE